MAGSQTATNSWLRGMQNAGAKAKESALAVSVAPGQKAAAAAELYRRKVNEAVDSGRFQDGAAAISLQEWQRAYIDKGIPRISSGATAALPKVQRFNDFWQPVCAASKTQVASMAKGTLEDSKARMIANMEYLARNKYKGRR